MSRMLLTLRCQDRIDKYLLYETHDLTHSEYFQFYEMEDGNYEEYILTDELRGQCEKDKKIRAHNEACMATYATHLKKFKKLTVELDSIKRQVDSLMRYSLCNERKRHIDGGDLQSEDCDDKDTSESSPDEENEVDMNDLIEWPDRCLIAMKLALKAVHALQSHTEKHADHSTRVNLTNASHAANSMIKKLMYAARFRHVARLSGRLSRMQHVHSRLLAQILPYSHSESIQQSATDDLVVDSSNQLMLNRIQRASDSGTKIEKVEYMIDGLRTKLMTQSDQWDKRQLKDTANQLDYLLYKCSPHIASLRQTQGPDREYEYDPETIDELKQAVIHLRRTIVEVSRKFKQREFPILRAQGELKEMVMGSNPEAFNVIEPDSVMESISQELRQFEQDLDQLLKVLELPDTPLGTQTEEAYEIFDEVLEEDLDGVRPEISVDEDEHSSANDDEFLETGGSEGSDGEQPEISKDEGETLTIESAAIGASAGEDLGGTSEEDRTETGNLDIQHSVFPAPHLLGTISQGVAKMTSTIANTMRNSTQKSKETPLQNFDEILNQWNQYLFGEEQGIGIEEFFSKATLPQEEIPTSEISSKEREYTTRKNKDAMFFGLLCDISDTEEFFASFGSPVNILRTSEMWRNALIGVKRNMAIARSYNRNPRWLRELLLADYDTQGVSLLLSVPGKPRVGERVLSDTSYLKRMVNVSSATGLFSSITKNKPDALGEYADWFGKRLTELIGTEVNIGEIQYSWNNQNIQKNEIITQQHEELKKFTDEQKTEALEKMKKKRMYVYPSSSDSNEGTGSFLQKISNKVNWCVLMSHKTTKLVKEPGKQVSYPTFLRTILGIDKRDINKPQAGSLFGYFVEHLFERQHPWYTIDFWLPGMTVHTFLKSMESDHIARGLVAELVLIESAALTIRDNYTQSEKHSESENDESDMVNTCKTLLALTQTLIADANISESEKSFARSLKLIMSKIKKITQVGTDESNALSLNMIFSTLEFFETPARLLSKIEKGNDFLRPLSVLTRWCDNLLDDGGYGEPPQAVQDCIKESEVDGDATAVKFEEMIGPLFDAEGLVCTKLEQCYGVVIAQQVMADVLQKYPVLQHPSMSVGLVLNEKRNDFYSPFIQLMGLHMQLQRRYNGIRLTFANDARAMAQNYRVICFLFRYAKLHTVRSEGVDVTYILDTRQSSLGDVNLQTEEEMIKILNHHTCHIITSGALVAESHRVRKELQRQKDAREADIQKAVEQTKSLIDNGIAQMRVDLEGEGNDETKRKQIEELNKIKSRVNQIDWGKISTDAIYGIGRTAKKAIETGLTCYAQAKKLEGQLQLVKYQIAGKALSSLGSIGLAYVTGGVSSLII